MGHIEIIQPDSQMARTGNSAKLSVIDPFVDGFEPSGREPQSHVYAESDSQKIKQAVRQAAFGAIALSFVLSTGIHQIQETVDGTPCLPGPNQVAINLEQKNMLADLLAKDEIRLRFTINPLDIHNSMARIALRSSIDQSRIDKDFTIARKGLKGLYECEYPRPDRRESDTTGYNISADVVDSVQDVTSQLDNFDQKVEVLDKWLKIQALRRRIFI